MSQFLNDPEVRDEAQSVISAGCFDNVPPTTTDEAAVGMHMVQSIRDIIGKIYSSTKKNRRLRDDERAFINFVATTACYNNLKDVTGLSKYIIGTQLGLSHGAIHRNFEKGDKRAKQIQDGRMDHFSWFDNSKERTKYGEDELNRLCQWFIKDCELIIYNPIKGDSVFLRDKNSE